MGIVVGKELPDARIFDSGYVNYMQQFKRLNPQLSFTTMMAKGASFWDELSLEEKFSYRGIDDDEYDNQSKSDSDKVTKNAYQNFLVWYGQTNKNMTAADAAAKAAEIWCRLSMEERAVFSEMPLKKVRRAEQTKGKRGNRPKRGKSKRALLCKSRRRK